MLPLAQPPRKDDRVFDDWMYRLWKRISSTAGLAWDLIDKTGSNLTDLETRNHNDLQNISGGASNDYSHLTAAQNTALTGGAVTALHKHDFDNITFPTQWSIGTMTHVYTLQELMNHEWSAGVVDGCALTDNGDGTVSIASGVAVIRAVPDGHTTLYGVIVPAQANIALTDKSSNYIYLDYNGGTPQFAVSTSLSSFNCMDKCIAYLVHRDGNLLHWVDAREQNVDGNRKTRQLFLNFSRFIHSEGGTVLGSSGLAITLTAGSFNFMLENLPHPAFDTTVAGTANVNVFNLWYRNGSGGWTSTSNQKTVTTTTYDNNTGTPATIGNNKFGVTWFYIINDTPSELHAVMGQAEYPNLASAVIASPPSSTPSIIGSLGSLVGFVVYEKSAVTFSNVLSAFTNVFVASSPTDHNGLAGLQGGAVNEYYHLTASDVTRLSNTSGTNTGDQILSDATISTTDITTNNVSTSKHGFFPKLPVATGLYLKDDLTWGNPTAGSGISLAESRAVSSLRL